MKGFSPEFKVGLFTALGLFVLGYVFVFLKGNPFSSEKQQFYSILPNAQGVGERTQIRTSGVAIGQVVTIAILAGGVRVDYEIDSAIKVPVGSVIDIRSRGLLGDVYIEIERAQDKGNNLKPGSEIPITEDSNNMSTIMSNIGKITTDVKKITSNLAKALGSEETGAQLSEIIANIHAVTKDAKEIFQSQKQEIYDIIASIKHSALHVEKLIADNTSKVYEIIDEVRATARNLDTFSTHLKNVLNDENRAKIQVVIDQIEHASQHINEASDRINVIVKNVQDGKGTLGQLLSKDETANELKETIKDIRKIVDPIARLRIDFYYRGEYRFNPQAPNSHFANQFNLVLSTRPDRFYLLGVADAPYARKVTDTTKITDNNGNQQTISEVQTKPQDVGLVRYNLQIGSIFGDHFGLRLGLFESYAGFAADTYFLDGRLMASVEVSQFSDASDASTLKYTTRQGFVRMKAYANFFLLKNLFITAGYDGLIRDSKPFPFVGGGISFSDDDIKAIVGTAAIAASGNSL